MPEDPLFLSYEPDFEAMEKLVSEYGKYENILIIANGGSISSFYGFYHALKYQTKKQAYFLSTLDPDYIYELKQTLRPENTLVFCISKSGENTMQLEMTMPFVSFPMLVVTEKNTPLFHIAEKLKLTVVEHPKIGGRYTGFTEVGLLPAAFCGIDVKALYKGGKKVLQKYPEDNLAFKAASVLWQLEKQGYVDVFMPFYSHYLFPMSALVVQLCHESFGKEGNGQTFLTSEAPESQHHTNQRFFGGIKNMIGFFIGTDMVMRPSLNLYPTEAHSVQIKGHPLFDINKIPLEQAFAYELQGTLEDAKVSGIPCAHLAVLGLSPDEVGQFTAFWQLFAVYSSVLRAVDPFNQPQVENSKNISFAKRLQYKGLL